MLNVSRASVSHARGASGGSSSASAAASVTLRPISATDTCHVPCARCPDTASQSVPSPGRPRAFSTRWQSPPDPAGPSRSTAMMRSIVGVAGFRSAGLASRRCAHRSSQHDPPPRPAADALDAGDRVCPSRPAGVNHMQNGRTEAIHVAHTLVPCPQDTIIVNIINNRRIVTGRASARTTRTVRLIGHSPYFPGASGWRGGAEWASRWLWWRRSPAPEARPLPLPRRTLGPMDIGDGLASSQLARSRYRPQHSVPLGQLFMRA